MKKSIKRELNSYSNWYCIEDSNMKERRYEKKKSHKTFRRKGKRGIKNELE